MKKERNEIGMAKRKLDTGKIVTKIIAGILALLMVLGMAATLLFYVVGNI